mmetsp:Transcript_62119/g.202735  ORF Transcript_62119/g.202735 Transcript_62119/m.202735 type:complete len:493 (-) Transcript_62119:254-1732(-)
MQDVEASQITGDLASTVQVEAEAEEDELEDERDRCLPSRWSVSSVGVASDVGGVGEDVTVQVGDAARVFCRTEDAWFDGQVTAVHALGRVSVVFEAGDGIRRKTLSLTSAQLFVKPGLVVTDPGRPMQFQQFQLGQGVSVTMMTTGFVGELQTGGTIFWGCESLRGGNQQKAFEVADEQRRLAVAAEDTRRRVQLQQEAAGQRWLRQAAEQRLQQETAAEQHRLQQQVADEQRRLAAAAEEERRRVQLAREAAEQRRLQEEAAGERRRLAEEAERHRLQATATAAEQRRLQQAAEQRRLQQGSAAEPHRVQQQGAEGGQSQPQRRQLQAAAAEQRRLQQQAADEQRRPATEERHAPDTHSDGGSSEAEIREIRQRIATLTSWSRQISGVARSASPELHDKSRSRRAHRELLHLPGEVRARCAPSRARPACSQVAVLTHVPRGVHQWMVDFEGRPPRGPGGFDLPAGVPALQHRGEGECGRMTDLLSIRSSGI